MPNLAETDVVDFSGMPILSVSNIKVQLGMCLTSMQHGTAGNEIKQSVALSEILNFKVQAGGTRHFVKEGTMLQLKLCSIIYHYATCQSTPQRQYSPIIKNVRVYKQWLSSAVPTNNN